MNRLIGAKAIPRLQRAPIEDHERLERIQSVEVPHAPRAHDLAPVRDRHRARRRAAAVVEVRREKIEALRLHAEVRIGDAALADQNDLLAAPPPAGARPRGTQRACSPAEGWMSGNGAPSLMRP